MAINTYKVTLTKEECEVLTEVTRTGGLNQTEKALSII